MVDVEVVYLGYHQTVFLCRMSVRPDATVGDVLEQSQIYQKYPETLSYSVGIFSRLVEKKTGWFKPEIASKCIALC